SFAMPFAMVGAAGSVILFITTLVYTVLAGAITVMFAAHSYLAIVQDTAAGVDRVKVPPEAPLGGGLPAGPLGGLSVFRLVPAGFLARALGDVWLPDQGGLRFLLLAVPGLWLFYPLAMLFTLAGNATAKPDVAGGLLRNAPAVFGFYLITGLLL